MDLTDFIHTVESIRKRGTCLSLDNYEDDNYEDDIYEGYDLCDCNKCPFFDHNYDKVNVTKCRPSDLFDTSQLLKSWDEMITKKKMELI